jgi:chorismate-pyruvate lyase
MKTKDINNPQNDLISFWKRKLSRLLLSTDGSTTRTLSALVGGNLEVQLKHQKTIKLKDIPPDIQPYFPREGSFLHRVTSLKYHQDVLSDNAVFMDISLSSTELQDDIYQGKIPLGLLIANTEYRRKFFECTQMKPAELGHLFSPINLPSEGSLVKKYIIIRDQKCWFYICEVFHLEPILKCFLAE